MIAKIERLGEKKEITRSGKPSYNVRDVTMKIGDKSKEFSTWGKHADGLDRFNVNDDLEFEMEAPKQEGYKPNLTNPRKVGEAIPQKQGWGGGGKAQANPETMLCSYAKDLLVASMGQVSPVDAFERLADEAQATVTKWYKHFKEIVK